MMQVQVVIELAEGRSSLLINQLAREDATPDERAFAQAIEDLLLSVNHFASEQAGMTVTEERIGPPPADAKPAPKPLRAGDHVHHRPSGEEWVVAYQDGEHVGWCGWPAGEALAADCDLILAVTDTEHLAILRRLENGGDKRARMAREALAKLFGGSAQEGGRGNG